MVEIRQGESTHDKVFNAHITCLDNKSVVFSLQGLDLLDVLGLGGLGGSSCRVSDEPGVYSPFILLHSSHLYLPAMSIIPGRARDS